MKPTLLALGLIAAITATASAQTLAGALSLEEAIAIALERNRLLANDGLAEAQAAAHVVTARRRLLPRFGVETQVSRLLRPVNILFPEGAFGTYSSTGPVPATDTRITTSTQASVLFNVQVTQPLTGLGSARLDVQLSEAARELDREQTRSTRQSLVNDVKQAYYRILQTASALDVAESDLRTLQEIGRIVDNRLAERVALKAEALDVQARLAQANLTRTTLRHTLASGKEQLNLLLGRDIGTEFDVAVPPTSMTVALDAARSRAIADRPDVRQARVRVRQAELSERLARWDRVPEVSLALESISPFNVEGAPRNITTAGIQLKWEPFDWGRKARTVASRGLAVRQAQNAAAEIEARALLEINARFRRLDEARAKLQVAALSRDTATEHARVQVVRYETATSLLSDVLQARAALAATNDDYQQALLAVLMAQADLEQALGEDVTK